jgi:hypothetical protein
MDKKLLVSVLNAGFMHEISIICASANPILLSQATGGKPLQCLFFSCLCLKLGKNMFDREKTPVLQLQKEW